MAVLAGTLAPPVLAVEPATLAAQGNGRGALACAACHGADGGGQAAAGYPRLAGLDAAYLEAQLTAFAGGSRENAVMQPIAGALSVAERRGIAGYYAKLALPAATGAATTAAPPDDGVGAQLAIRGRWSRQVPACVQCHGPRGIGVGAHFPPLAGQPARYLVAQMQAFAHGTRRNDPLALMRHLSRKLDENDMRAVADWFAAQPVVAPEHAP